MFISEQGAERTVTQALYGVCEEAHATPHLLFAFQEPYQPLEDLLSLLFTFSGFLVQLPFDPVRRSSSLFGSDWSTDFMRHSRLQPTVTHATTVLPMCISCA